MEILHISCSPRGPASESRRLAHRIIERLQVAHPVAAVIERVLGQNAPQHIDHEYATVLGGVGETPSDALSTGTMALSELLIRELEDADVVVISTPMHNFTVPSALKAWLDHIVRVRRTFDMSREGKIGRLHDRPVLVALSSGGAISGERPRQPDFLTPYLKAILAVIGLHDVTFFSIEGTGAGLAALEAAREKADQALTAYFVS